MKSAFSLLMALVSAFSATVGLAAPSISLSTGSIQSDANIILTHTISGIAQGDAVTVERFADVNGNGAIDSGEPPLRTFVVQDGVRPTIGGIVNGNVPGDDDGVANGSIRIDLPFPGVDAILNRQPGKYVIRVTTSSSQTATAAFEITAPNYPQRVTGVLKNSANNANISFGIIVILVGEGEPIGSVRTDGTGAFNFVAPAGDYVLVPISDGFIAPMQFVSIPANQTVTQNLTMTPAPVRVSGKLSDAATGAALPGVFVLAQAGNDQSQLISGAMTRLDGNYSFSVTSGSWQISPLGYSSAQLGYMSDESSPAVNVGSTPLTLNLSAQKATALIYGKLTNPSNAAVPNITLRAQVPMGGGLESQGRSDANGNYFLGLLAGSWDVHTEGAAAFGFREESTSFTVAAGSATKWDASLLGFTAHVRGRVVDSSGNGIANVQIHGRYGNNQQSSTQSTTSADGSFDLPVWAGNWSIELDQDAGLINHVVHVTVVDGVDQNITYTVPNSTGQISGTVKNTSGSGLVGLFVNASANINGIDYQSGANTDATGHYQLPVINGSWNVSISCGDLQSQGYDCPQNQLATINNNGATINFTLNAFVTTASINGHVVNETGAAMPGLQIGAYNQSSSASRSDNSAADGSFSIPVYAGQWSLQVFDLPNGYIAPNQQFTVLDGVNINNVQIKLLQANATITGTLKSTTGAAISGIRIYPSTAVDNANYSLQFATTDANGAFNFSVSRGAWSIGVDCGDLDAKNFTCVNPPTVDTTSGAATVNLTAAPKISSTPLEIQSPMINQSGQNPIFSFTLHGAPGTYDIFGAPDLNSQWLQIMTTTISFGGNSSTPEFNPGPNHFFKVQLHQ